MKWLKDAVREKVKLVVEEMLEEDLDVNPYAKYDWSGMNYLDAMTNRIVDGIFDD